MTTKKVAKKAVKRAKKIPAAPECDPRMGQKDPNYVAWLKKYHPDTYAAKFTNWKGKS